MVTQVKRGIEIVCTNCAYAFALVIMAATLNGTPPQSTLILGAVAVMFFAEYNNREEPRPTRTRWFEASRTKATTSMPTIGTLILTLLQPAAALKNEGQKDMNIQTELTIATVLLTLTATLYYVYYRIRSEHDRQDRYSDDLEAGLYTGKVHQGVLIDEGSYYNDQQRTGIEDIETGNGGGASDVGGHLPDQRQMTG